MQKKEWKEAMPIKPAYSKILSNVKREIVIIPVLTTCGNVIFLGGNHQMVTAGVLKLDKEKNSIMADKNGNVFFRFVIRRDNMGYCTIHIGQERFNYNKFTSDTALLEWLDTFSLNHREVEVTNNVLKFKE